LKPSAGTAAVPGQLPMPQKSHESCPDALIVITDWHGACSMADAMLSPQLLEEYSQFFRLLSEPARLQLLCLLRQGPLDVAALIEATGFSQSHISRQLGQLQRAGLVNCERDGVRLIYRADDPLVEDLCTLVQNRLRQRLEARLQQLSPHAAGQTRSRPVASCSTETSPGSAS
jgi:DNA-binding transcriptional ArsR family regulator